MTCLPGNCFGFQLDKTANCVVFNPKNAGILFLHYMTS